MPKFSSNPVDFLATLAPITGDRPYQLLAEYATEAGEHARPIVVHVNVYNQALAGEAAGVAVLPSTLHLSGNWQGNFADTGRLKFTYGAGAARRVIITDLKSGSYQLPPSEQVRVQAAVSSTTLAPFGLNLTVSAACVEGWQAAPARPVLSTIVDLAAAAEFTPSPYPDGARWVDIMVNALGTGFGFPVIEWLDQNGGSPTGSNYMLRDFVNQVFLPAMGPIEIGSTEGGWRLRNSGAVAATTTVRFFLEF